MLMKVTHQTDLSYSDLVTETIMELRMAPRQEQDQHRLSFNLSIGPPAQVTSYFDWLGNMVHTFSINTFHKQVRIVATSIVETDRPPKQPEDLQDPWPLSDTGGYANEDFLQFADPVVDTPLLRQLVESFAPRRGMPVADLLFQMLRAINEKYTYEKGVTTATSSITEILEHKRGVCQDFTHLLIGMARALRIPARYVSGIIHADSQFTRGAAQTHAWAELYFPSHGWVGMDPTNSCIIGPNFIKIAVGRSYRDVPPNKGLYKGRAAETMQVTVHTEPLKSIPPRLHAERVTGLNLESVNPTFDVNPDQLYQLEEQQQQQQQGQQQNQVLVGSG